MPKKTRQVQGEIIHELRKEDLITQKRLQEVMADAEIESPSTVRTYTRALIEADLLRRAEGGYKLTAKARQDSIIRIRVPRYNEGPVIKGVGAALQQFRPLAVMEIDV